MRNSIRHRLTAVGVLSLVVVMTGCSTTQRERSPRPGVPTDGPALVWVGDFETGDLSQFKDTPWNVTRGGEKPRIVDDPQLVRQGRYAVRISIPTKETNDRDGACCDPRSELEPNIGDIHEGDDLWFAFSTMLAPDFPIDADWQVITQWKARSDGSPPVSFKVKKGRILLSGGEGNPDKPRPYAQDLADAAPGTWSDWVVHIKFSTDPSDGYVEVWQNGRQVLQRYAPPGGTMYPAANGGEQPESYLKTGYYRSGEISRPGVLYFDGWRVGATREAVSPA